MSKRHSISVIIPAYNRAGLIGETLQSLLNQTVPATEIIVVDDGSTDDTARVVERIAEEIEVRRAEIDNKQGAGCRKQGALDAGHMTLDSPPLAKPRLRVHRQANAGPGSARNRGLAEAKGEFIHFFDSDDIAAPNKQEVQLRALLETGADIAYGPWIKGRLAPEEVRRVARLNSVNTRYQLPATLYSGFIPEGPVLQARGLPKSDLVRALLTNWSIVPHACLFRRSILQNAGGFPEDIWVGEDQLLFLRCLLAGAKVVHTPGTMVYYRVGNDPGKLTATGAAQKRHARDWGRFLISAKQEIEDRRSKIGEVPTEAQRRGDFFGDGGSRGLWRTDVVSHGGTANTEEPQGDAQGTCAGASEPDSLASKLADSTFSESLTRSASGPASLPATSYSLPATAPEALTTPSSWFGFRLRAYEAWRDLERFFPDGEVELKENLKRIFLEKRKFPKTEILKYQAAGFLLRKLAGLKLRALGYREHGSFRCERPSRRAGQKIGPVK